MASSDANLNPSVDDETANQGKTIIVKLRHFLHRQINFPAPLLILIFWTVNQGPIVKATDMSRTFDLSLKGDFAYSVISYVEMLCQFCCRLVQKSCRLEIRKIS